MTENSSSLIIAEVLRISARLKNGTLQGRLCAKCGNFKHYGSPCVPAEPLRGNKAKR